MEEILNNAKELRKNQTEQEKRLWYELRNRRFFNLKFKRQVPIGNYIVDFLCVEKMLIIELDGGQHNFDKNVSYDNQRTMFLPHAFLHHNRNGFLWDSHFPSTLPFVGVQEDFHRFRW